MLALINSWQGGQKRKMMEVSRPWGGRKGNCSPNSTQGRRSERRIRKRRRRRRKRKGLHGDWQ
jgi:hypothetical protein